MEIQVEGAPRRLRVLAIGPEERKRIQALRVYAEKHFYTMKMLEEVRDGKLSPPGDDPNFVIELSFGYRIVYTIESQILGMCRHISISVDTPGKVPSPMAVQMIIEEFGFRQTPDPDKRILTNEQFDDNRSAINIWEYL